MEYTERPKGYRPRIVDETIERYLKIFGAVEVSGTMWCGKTWSSLAHANSVTYVDRGTNLQLSTADLAYPLAGDAPHVVDEWQRVPAIWDAVRHEVDKGSGKGRWLLTESSAHALGEVSHSGSGRIGRVRMHPMTLAESDVSNGKVSLRGLFNEEFEPVQAPDASVRTLAEEITRGGWPEAAGMTPDGCGILLGSYLSNAFEVNVPRLGGDSVLARRTALSVARNLGQSAKQATYAADVFALGPEDKPTDHQLRQVAGQLSVLAALYLLDEVPGWVPASRSPERMRTKPKRYFADSSLAISLLGLSADALLQDWQTFGLAFENLCMRDIDVYARASGAVEAAPVKYYHDDSGLEADAVVELPDGRWGAMEIKMSDDKVEEGAKKLKKIREKLCSSPKSRTPQPSFLAVVTGASEAAYRRPDGIYVVPIRTLGA